MHEGISRHALEGTHRKDAPGPAEAVRARSSGSPTIQSGRVDAQPPLQYAANRGGRQRIIAALQSGVNWKRRWTLASRTTPPVCTTEGWKKDRRKVHEVTEQHDEAVVERRWPIPVTFALNLRPRLNLRRP